MTISTTYSTPFRMRIALLGRQAIYGDFFTLLPM